MADKYKSMTELINSTTEGSDWDFEIYDTSSSVISMAIHGGGIEPGTTELAKLLAEKSGYNYFSFVAKLPSGNSDLHVTSTKYDAVRIIEKIQDSTHSISIHGAGGNSPYTYMGGGNTALKNMIWDSLTKKGFDCRESPGSLAGVEPMNIANRTSIGMGVQLELSSQQRKDFFEEGNWGSNNRNNREKWTQTMHEYAEAIYEATEEYLKGEIQEREENLEYPFVNSLRVKKNEPEGEGKREQIVVSKEEPEEAILWFEVTD